LFETLALVRLQRESTDTIKLIVAVMHDETHTPIEQLSEVMSCVERTLTAPGCIFVVEELFEKEVNPGGKTIERD